MKHSKHERVKKALGKIQREEQLIQFDCEFSQKVRKMFRDRRQALGLSYNSLAQTLGVNWSTLRKWEMGMTRNCNLRHRLVIEDFLNGKLDETLLRNHEHELACSAITKNLTPRIANALEKIENTYKLCINRPDLCEHLWKSLNELSVIVLKRLLASEKDNEKM